MSRKVVLVTSTLLLISRSSSATMASLQDRLLRAQPRGRRGGLALRTGRSQRVSQAPRALGAGGSDKQPQQGVPALMPCQPRHLPVMHLSPLTQIGKLRPGEVGPGAPGLTREAVVWEGHRQPTSEPTSSSCGLSAVWRAPCWAQGLPAPRRQGPPRTQGQGTC
jgi:hypothetical protein